MKHKIIANWKSNLSFHIETLGGDIVIDANKEAGGDDDGLRPKALMLSSLAGCTGIDIASLIKKMRLKVDDVKIEVEAELSEEHPKKYTNVSINYCFKGNNLDQEKLKKAVNLSVEKYCGVIAMFESFANIEININFE